MSPQPASEPLRIDVEHRGEALVARLIGSANLDDSPNLGEQLLALVDRKPSRLVLDLSGLNFINSTGLGDIISAHLRSRNNQVAIALAAPTPSIGTLLEVTKLNMLLSVYPSVDEALTGVCH